MFCSYIQRLLDRISNGTLPDDRRSAIVELQSVVAESNAAQLAFGAASGKSLSFFSVLRLTCICVYFQCFFSSLVHVEPRDKLCDHWSASPRKSSEVCLGLRCFILTQNIA